MSLLDGSYGTKAAKVTGFDVDNSITHTAGDDFTINVNGGGAVTVDLPAMTAATGSTAAAAIEGAINSALSAAGSAYAGKVKVSAQTVGAGSALTMEVSGLAAAQTFVLADGTGTPLAEMGLTGAVTAASGAGGTFQIGANAGESVTLAIGDLDATALGVGWRRRDHRCGRRLGPHGARHGDRDRVDHPWQPRCAAEPLRVDDQQPPGHHGEPLGVREPHP